MFFEGSILPYMVLQTLFGNRKALEAKIDTLGFPSPNKTCARGLTFIPVT